jgi:hypothetical protein
MKLPVLPAIVAQARSVWSLWDMLKHDAAKFYYVTGHLAMTRVAIEYNVAHGRARDDQTFSVIELEIVKTSLEAVRTALPDGSELTVMAIDELLGKMSSPMTIEKLTDGLRTIEGRLKDGLELAIFLAMSPDEARLYEPKRPLFGEVFPVKFPSLIYEVDEAAKCLALGRSTAAAFHSLRCLEAGIRAMSRCLDIPDPTKAHERSWMKLLEKLDTGIKSRWPTNSNRMDGDGRFFDEAYAALAAMQNPWRNATMHLDQKYMPDEAAEIFDAVRRFMGRVANRMDENGDPKVP